MTRSMTAFARQAADTPVGHLLWELRSVNHRYLELSLRLPDDFRALETAVREAAQKRLERGKLDCTLRFERKEGTGALAVNDTVVRQLDTAARKLGQTMPALAPASALEVLRWPGVLQAEAVDVSALGATALQLLHRTLDELIDTRTREGARLAGFVQTRLDSMHEIVTGVIAIMPEIKQNYRVRLTERLGELKRELDPQRLELEVLLFAQRADVAEELDRLRAHAAEIARVLSQNGQQGRRLDFLMQELNREANTLASKATDIRVTNAAVELKVSIEQMREQIQNIE